VQVLSYNILLGGAPRIDQLTSMIRGSQADLVGLAEATNPYMVEELAKRLKMHFFLTGRGKSVRDWNVALLSRYPIISTQTHTNPAIFYRHHVLEATLEEPGGQHITAFVAHFTASFQRGPESNRMRRAETQEIMRLMQSQKGKPHLLMGDFNSVAPGDTLNANHILRYTLQMRSQDQQRRQKKAEAAHKQYTPLLRERLITGAIQFLIHNQPGRALINASTPLYTKGGIDLLLQDGYTDCFRKLHPDQPGYTFPSADPACRIDYIFASPELATRLQSCSVIKEGEGVGGDEASDHLPICAEFRA
jgi:endonuclease/exonuclease/phosphatase family metal-dependent hydrolase